MARDDSGRELTYSQLLEEASNAKNKIRPQIDGKAHVVGILLQDRIEAVIANLAITLLGKVAVNLDIGAEPAATDRAIKQAGIRSVITSNNWECETVEIDEALDHPGKVFDPDMAAAIQFTSGRSEEQKGVILSHHNILSSIDALATVLQPEEPGCILGNLPFYNVYGFVLNLWLPLLTGMQIAFVSDSHDANLVGQTISDKKVDILAAPPSLLGHYQKNLNPRYTRGLKHVFSGGAPLSQELARAIEETFSIVPLEAYGMTEVSGVCALSIPNVKINRFRETGQREGSQGRLLPGIAMKIIDPDTGEPCGPDETGRVCIKGETVMKGYLDRERTNAFLQDGWFFTDDIGSLDKDGFFTIRNPD